MAKFLLQPKELGTLWLFAGQKRSGKSYHAVEIIDKFTRQGGHVLTNLDIFPPKSWRRRKVRIERLNSAREVVARAISFREETTGGILIVLDEVGAVFDSRNFSKFPADLRAFLTQHAKMGIHVIAIVHRVGMVDSSFRNMADYCVEHWSASRFPGVAGLLFGMLAPGVMYRHTRVVEAGELSDKSYEKRFFVGKEKIYKLYDTLQIVEGSSAGNKDLRKALLPSFGFRRKALMVFLIWCVFRFTPLNRPVEQAAVGAAEVTPYATLGTEVIGYDLPYKGTVEVCTSSGLVLRYVPPADWGSPNIDWIGRFVELDIPTTSPLLSNNYYRKEIDNATKYTKDRGRSLLGL